VAVPDWRQQRASAAASAAAAQAAALTGRQSYKEKQLEEERRRCNVQAGQLQTELREQQKEYEAALAVAEDQLAKLSGEFEQREQQRSSSDNYCPHHDTQQ
jgi:hypothetical protein